VPSYDLLVEAGAESVLAEAEEAVQAGEWARARAAFETVLKLDDFAEARLGLGNVLWWLGETEGSVRQLELAYAAFRRRPDNAQAALVAVYLSLTYRASLGNYAASNGWLRRAVRLVEEGGLAPLAGWVALCRSVAAADEEDTAAAEACAGEALAAARDFGDHDLELCALSELGSALVAMGRLDEGAALLDEAMAGSLGGEVEPDTVVLTSCTTVVACARAGDFVRATQWIRAADEFNRRYGSPHLYAVCRNAYGSVLLATGRWAEAEAELRAGLEIARSAEPALRAELLAKLAELRLAQGRLEEAERLLEGLADEPAAVVASAAVLLARGRAAHAVSLLERRLRQVDEECLEASVLLELLVEAGIERGAVPDVTARLQRLAEVGASSRCDLLVARAERALGRVLLADGRAAEAAARFERALSRFGHLGMPLEVARSRLLLARALERETPELAIAEAEQALAGLEGLDPARDTDAAAAFLRSLGVKAARSSPRKLGTLTRREQEVLELLAEGLSNPEIAKRLFLSRKTVEHHVASILAKLGVGGRGEAAAYALREFHRERGSATR
jgi:ATP/maltotriose-dependent transcriptional regulator MalT